MKQQKVYLLSIFDEWMSLGSRHIIGIFSSKEKAIDALKQQYDKKEFDIYQNNNQFEINKFYDFVCEDCDEEFYEMPKDGKCDICGKKLTYNNIDLIETAMVEEFILDIQRSK